MQSREQKALFKTAMELYRRGRNSDAATAFRELIDSGSRDAKHLSYAGLVVALEGDVKTGLAWCERAVEIAFGNAVVYINLARLHERTGWKSQATKVLRKGLRIAPGNEKLLKEIDRISPREPDPIPGLPRNHPLNRTLSKIRHELKGKDKARAKRKTTPSYS